MGKTPSQTFPASRVENTYDIYIRGFVPLFADGSIVTGRDFSTSLEMTVILKRACHIGVALRTIFHDNRHIGSSDFPPYDAGDAYGGVMSSSQRNVHRHPWRRLLGFIGGLVGLMLIGLLISLAISPKPGVFAIRTVFRNGDQAVTEALAKHTPDDVTSITNEAYRPNDPDAKLDVHIPNSAIEDGTQLPTVVWTHGGAWVAGDKDEWAPYFMVLASRGYTVVGIDYSLGPEQTYPTALHQLNDALAYIQENAERFHIDPENLVLAGDSAGSQLSSQFATIVTSPEYAAQVGIEPTITPEQLKGVILYCGIYDFATYFDGTGLIGWGASVSIWAYTGNRAKTFDKNPALAEMSSLNHVTADFPPTFISGGNADPLTPNQSKALATKLEELGVAVTPLFFPDNHEPRLPHEYQFNLDNADGQHALDESVTFLESVFSKSD